MKEIKPLDIVMAARGRRKWERISPRIGPLRPGARILDLGSGEGHVGTAAAAERGVAVTLADISDYGAPGRPLVCLQDGPLPFPDDAFDATLIVFVLHHSRSPQHLLAEALRVTRGPVAVLETVHIRWVPKEPLQALDRLVNAVRSGGRMDDHTDIRTSTHWLQTAERLSARVESVRTYGTLHPQMLLILRRT